MNIKFSSSIDIETAFVNNFIIEEKRERVLFELFSKKKRGHILHKLWSAYTLYIEKYIIDVPSHLFDNADKFQKYLTNYGAEDYCYIIAGGSKYDQTILEIRKGIYVYEEFTSIVILNSNLAFFKNEFYKRHLLFKNDGKGK